MKKNLTIIILSIILLILVIGTLLYNNLKLKTFESNIFYMDTYINVKIYENDSKKANKALKEVENIFSEYHKLTDKYNSYQGITNLYTINNNVLTHNYLKIDEKLYKLIEYGISLYEKSNGKIDISMGNVIDIWAGYRSSGLGIPTIEELKYVNFNNIKEIELKDNNLIKNNNLNIDLGSIAKGYTTEIAKEYLESIDIDKYIINAGGNVVVGKKNNKDLYKIGLENPNNNGDIYKVIKTSNKAIVTSGSNERYYEYEGIKYSHIIDPVTLFPTNYMKSVTVVTDDSSYGDFLSTYLFLLSVEDGKKIVESLDNVEAIWYLNDDTYVTSKGFNKYE